MGTSKIEGTEAAWESGQLGRDMEHARPAPQDIEAQIDEFLGMQMISIRLQKELIDDFKKIAEFRGTGYQPLMREALQAFACAEFKSMATGSANPRAAKPAEQSASPSKPLSTKKTPA